MSADLTRAPSPSSLATMLGQEEAQPLLVLPPSIIHLEHLINASSSRTLEASDLRYFSVIDATEHLKFAPSHGGREKLLFFARRSPRGQPGELNILRSLTTAVLSISARRPDRMELLTTRPVVDNYMLASNLEVSLFSSRNGKAVLYGLGGHHHPWDERRGFSQLSKHQPAVLRPRDGVRLITATNLQQVLDGSWVPWVQTFPSGWVPGRGIEQLRDADVKAREVAAKRARKAAVVVTGRHPGCLEAFNRYAPVCFFDSKMSLARFRGRYLMFARANTVDRGGGRFVQVASTQTDNPAGPYGSFQLLKIDGYRSMRSGNIYTAVMRQHPLDETMLIGLFSVNEGVPGKVNRDGKCYIAISLSCDGVHWSRLRPLLKTEGEKGRTFDQPVSGLLRRGAVVQFFVQRDVPQISYAAPSSSRLERHSFNTEALMRLTAKVKMHFWHLGICNMSRAPTERIGAF
jgi:hypothetical protein